MSRDPSSHIPSIGVPHKICLKIFNVRTNMVGLLREAEI